MKSTQQLRRCHVQPDSASSGSCCRTGVPCSSFGACSGWDASCAQEEALQLFGELGQRIANSYAGFVSGAASALLRIVKGGMEYALQVSSVTYFVAF